MRIHQNEKSDQDPIKMTWIRISVGRWYYDPSFMVMDPCCEFGSLNITAAIFYASKSRHLKVFCRVRINWNLFFFEEKKVTKKFNNLTKLKRSCHTGIVYISKCTLCTLILTQSIVFLSNSIIIMRSKFRLQLREQQFALSVWG